MMKQLFTIITLVALAFLALPDNAAGQGKLADYKRAYSFQPTTRNKVLHSPDNYNWIKDKNQLWYVMQTKNGKRFMIADADSKVKSEAFDHDKVAAMLADKTKQKVSGDSLPFNALTFLATGEIEFEAFGEVWNMDKTRDELKATKKPVRSFSRNRGYWGDAQEDRPVNVTSPDSQWVAYIRNQNVYVRPNKINTTGVQMSFDGSPGDYYSSRMFWSPDSKKLVAIKTRPATQRKIFFVESSPKTQLQPILHERNYAKPGDALPQNQPVLFDIEKKQSFSVDPDLILNQYNLGHVQWRKDSREYTFEYNQRGHQLYQVFAMNAATGKARPVITETSQTFIDYSGKKYRKDVNDGREIIWASERDGWNHLYLYDGTTGQVKNQITKGEWVVRNVVQVNEEERYILFAGSGRTAGQDPYFIQYYRVNFDGSGLTQLTNENGNHRATFSPDFSTFVDVCSRVDMPPVSVLRSARDGNIIMELEKADAKELLATGWKYPEVFYSKGRDGATDIWGVIIRPSNYNSKKKYPVIEYIYAGPHSSFVPKDFGLQQNMAAIAELGFIVVQIDGMGTSNRSKAFHDVCWKNLKDAGFPDRILWMQAAAAKYPSMDLSRVGIYGTSAGGQSSTGAVLFHPEFYKVAVSSCGCHDNRMDKIWWNEQWMGYPVGPQYEESSNVVNAHRLQGKLMLILGEVDDNVDPASTMQVVDALIKANKEHELIVVPGSNHSSGGDYGEHKRRDFFVKHLLGVDPPEWSQLAEVMK